MKLNPLFLIIILASSLTMNAQYDHQNINLLGHFSDSNVVAEPQYGIKYQACWGWSDSNGKEYGIIGSTAGTYIVDVTNPSNLIQCDYVPHHQTDCIWHEYKTYGNLLYIISDDAGTGFQIADLSYLPDSVHLIYDGTSLFEHAHTIFIDHNKLYLGSVSSGFNFSSMNVYSLNNLASPVLLHRLDQDYPFISSVHDMYVVNDTVYASCGYDGLYILKYDSVSNVFHQISSLQDNSNIYNHSSVISPDRSVLYVCEEVPDGRPVKIVDVHDVALPELDSTFFTHSGATPHNPEIINNILYIAYYMDGVYAYDISDPFSPVQIGFFDTYPLNSPASYPSPAYSGCWSTYAYLPSRKLLAGDTELGLFVLDVSGINGIQNIHQDVTAIYPNPASDFIRIKSKSNSSVKITDISGKIFLTQNVSQDKLVDISSLADGMYLVRVTDREGESCQKLIVNRNK